MKTTNFGPTSDVGSLERKPSIFVEPHSRRRKSWGAKWLELRPSWHYGYPQPDEDNFGYRQVTYDLSGYCEECGGGKRQKAPFRIKSEPKWGRRSIFQLNWVFDEYFVRPDTYEKIFKPLGIAYREVTNAKGTELKTVLQLVTDEEIRVTVDGLPADTCRKCQRTKYIPVTRGPFPPLAVEPRGHLAKTEQYFGSGASAWKGVIVSQKLASALKEPNFRGVSLRPVRT